MGDKEFLTKDEWIAVVKCHLGTNQFEILNTKLKRLSEGGGFLGEHRLAEVTVRLHDAHHTQRVLNFFIKAQLETVAQQKEAVETSGAFKREFDVLSKLFVKFRSVLQNGGEDMPWDAKCYYTRPDVIVFEDMAVKGFRVLNSRIEFRWQHCAVVLKAMSNLHSASLIFEEKHPMQPYRLDTEYADMFREIFFIKVPGYPGFKWTEASISVVLKLVEEIRGYEYLREMKTQIEDAMMSLFDFFKKSDRFRNVVSHGDMWRNNIFFRHEEDEPVEARMCDFQITRYTPPANDVMFFLYITTTRSFRAQYLTQLLAYYHDQLSQNLTTHNLDPERVLPWREFKESCEFYKKMGIVNTCASVHSVVPLINEDDYKYVLESSEEHQRFIWEDRRPEVMSAFNNNSFYREKITEIVEEFIEECIIKK